MPVGGQHTVALGQPISVESHRGHNNRISLYHQPETSACHASETPPAVYISERRQNSQPFMFRCERVFLEPADRLQATGISIAAAATRRRTVFIEPEPYFAS